MPDPSVGDRYNSRAQVGPAHGLWLCSSHRSSRMPLLMIAPGSGDRLSGNRARRWLLVVLVVAFVVRVAFDVPVFRHTSLALTPDARSGYVPLAHHLGDGYLHSESRLFDVGLYRTP